MNPKPSLNSTSDSIVFLHILDCGVTTSSCHMASVYLGLWCSDSSTVLPREMRWVVGKLSTISVGNINANNWFTQSIPVDEIHRISKKSVSLFYSHQLNITDFLTKWARISDAKLEEKCRLPIWRAMHKIYSGATGQGYFVNSDCHENEECNVYFTFRCWVRAPGTDSWFWTPTRCEYAPVKITH